MEFSVVAFNCHWGVGRFGDMRGMAYDVPRTIEAFDADIVVVPEVVRGYDGSGAIDPLVDAGYNVETVQLMDLNRRRDRAGLRDVVPRLGYWELGICSRFPVVARREIPTGTFGHDPVGTRKALALVLDVGGTKVELVGVHTSSRFYYLTPLRQLRALKRQLGDGGPQIIAGDFNFWGPPVAAVMRGWRRPVRGRTWPSYRPHSQIDHVLVRGGVEAVSGEVLGATPSDHRPVRAQLRLLP